MATVARGSACMAQSGSMLQMWQLSVHASCSRSCTALLMPRRCLALWSRPLVTTGHPSLGLSRGRQRSQELRSKADFRPSLDDVERISKGDGAKRRGTGSRQVPHRLNADERMQYDLAKQKGWLTVKGTGYRRERKGSPIANVFRQWCDAQARPCVMLEQGFGNDAKDTVLVDLATLRSLDRAPYRAACNRVGRGLDCSGPTREHRVPFTILAPSDSDLIESDDSSPPGADSSGAGGAAQQLPANVAADSLEDVQVATDQQAQRVRNLKDQQGLNNSSPEVQVEVSQLLALKDQLNALQKPESLDAGVPGHEVEQDAPTFDVPIWKLKADIMWYEADRSAAKDLAKSLVEALHSV